VIIGNPRTQKTEALLRSMGRFVDSLGGAYIAAEDSGIGVADTRVMRTVTPHVTGPAETKTAEGVRTGDPSPSTAYGTFVGIKAAVKYALGRGDLKGLKVAVQGMGNVGFILTNHLKEAGASLWVSDIHEDQVQRAVDQLEATAVPSEDIYGLDVHVFAPCAMGAIINDQTIPLLKARVVAGAANNQLAEASHGEELMSHGILYAPDYVINAGGVIDVFHQRTGFVTKKVREHVGGIYDTLMEIFERAESEGRPTQEVANAIAEERFRKR
jgi:leucine dehydrogenase